MMNVRLPRVHALVLAEEAKRIGAWKSAVLEACIRRYFAEYHPMTMRPVEDVLRPLAYFPEGTKRRSGANFGVTITASLWKEVEKVLARARELGRKPIPASRFLRLVIERTLLKNYISSTGRILMPGEERT